jgi:hypothetical protein
MNSDVLPPRAERGEPMCRQLSPSTRLYCDRPAGHGGAHCFAGVPVEELTPAPLVGQWDDGASALGASPETSPAERVARLYALPSGRWHADVTGPGNAWCGTSTRSLEAAVSFLVRRLLASGSGVCATGCEDGR